MPPALPGDGYRPSRALRFIKKAGLTRSRKSQRIGQLLHKLYSRSVRQFRKREINARLLSRNVKTPTLKRSRHRLGYCQLLCHLLARQNLPAKRRPCPGGLRSPRTQQSMYTPKLGAPDGRRAGVCAPALVWSIPECGFDAVHQPPEAVAMQLLEQPCPRGCLQRPQVLALLITEPQRQNKPTYIPGSAKLPQHQPPPVIRAPLCPQDAPR